MLKHFIISNYALIDHLELDWSNGFTAITGETGAGKSIIMGALGLIVGDRADTSVAKNKTEKVMVELTFDANTNRFQTLFNKYDLDLETTGIVRREISPSGKSRAFINDTPVKLNVLKELGELLVDIHGQHQTLLLKDSAFRLEILDHYAGLHPERTTYQELFFSYQKLNNQLKELEEREHQLKQTYEFNKFQLDELEQANLNDTDLEELENELKTLEHAEEIKSGLFEVVNLLSESDSNVIEALRQAETSLNSLAKFSSNLSEVSDRIATSLIEILDIDREIQALADDVEMNPELLNQLTERVDSINRLLTKHRCVDIAALITLRDELSESLANYNNIDASLEETRKELKKIEDELKQASDVLHKKRSNSIVGFSDSIVSILVDLGMAKSQFTVQLEPTEAYHSAGKESATFLFSANAGIEKGELHKVASGGELSRCMLALKTILSSKKGLPAIIFDEIDTGVSGKVASKLAKLLQNMSKSMQVICITHLPQVAARASDHLRVEKQEVNGISTSALVRLTHEERINELAAMLGGEEQSKAAIQNAKELLVNQ